VRHGVAGGERYEDHPGYDGDSEKVRAHSTSRELIATIPQK